MWTNTFLLPHEKPFFIAALSSAVVYLSINPIEKTKIVFSKVEDLLRIESQSVDTQAAKLALLDLLEDLQPNGIDATQEQRLEVDDITKFLERTNPSPKPAISPLNIGMWKLLYTDYSPAGPSSGKLGPFIGDVYQKLEPELNRITNILQVAVPPIEGSLTAKQTILDDKTWRIAFERVENSIAGIPLPSKTFPLDGQEGSQVRLWKYTYLDNDLRILRAGREHDNPEEFLFITIKA